MTARGLAALALCTAALAACQTDQARPASPGPIATVDLQPVTPLAGTGLELRVWPIDDTHERRRERNRRLHALLEDWHAIQRAREDEQATAEDQDKQPPDDAQPRTDAPAFGPPTTADDDTPATFEDFVALSLAAQPREGPGENDPARALEPFADTAHALDPQAAELWRANGFRLALVPRERLADLRRALGVRQPLARSWLGNLLRWDHLAVAPPGAPTILASDRGPARLGPGRMALLARAWEAPGYQRPVLRLELCPQFLPASARADPDAARFTPTGASPDHLARGAVFRRLLLTGSLPHDHALVIAPGPPQDDGHAIGPAAPGAIAIANALLRRRAADGTPAPIALVLVPVVGDPPDAHASAKATTAGR